MGIIMLTDVFNPFVTLYGQYVTGTQWSDPYIILLLVMIGFWSKLTLEGFDIQIDVEQVLFPLCG